MEPKRQPAAAEIMPRWFMWYRRPYNLICKQHQVDAEIFIMAYHCTAVRWLYIPAGRTDGAMRECARQTRAGDEIARLSAAAPSLEVFSKRRRFVSQADGLNEVNYGRGRIKTSLRPTTRLFSIALSLSRTHIYIYREIQIYTPGSAASADF